MVSKKKSSGASMLKKVLAVVFCAALLVTALAGCMPATDGTADASGENTGGGLLGMGGMVIYLVIIIAVFYFLMIRPEKKRKKKAEEMRNNISIGDNITTIGGMVGKVVNVSDEYITFETGEDRVRIKITKWGVSSTGKDAAEPDEKAGE